MLDLLGWGGVSDNDFKEGVRLFGIGSYAEAEGYFAKAVSNINGYFAPQTRRARVLVALAQAQWKQGKLKDAHATAESARDLISARRNSSDLALCLNLLGDIQEHRGNSGDALKLFREALEVEERVRPVQPVVLTERCRRLAKALTKASTSAESPEAKTLLNRALAIAGKRVGTRSLPATACLLDLGEFQIAHEEIEPGIASMERAIDIYRETNGDTCEEMAAGLQRLAHACHLAGDLEKAVYYYERALHVRDRQVGGNPADLGILLTGLAEAQSLIGNETLAIELLQQAVGKLQGTGDEHLACALESLGEGYGRTGRFGEAVSCYQKSRALWEKDPDAHQERLQENAVRLEEAMKSAPRQDVPSAPIFLEPRLTQSGGSSGSAQAPPRRKSVREFYGPPPVNPAAPEMWKPEPVPRAPMTLVPGRAPAAQLTTPAPINLEIHAPPEEPTSSSPAMPDLAPAGSTGIPALVTFSGMDPQGAAAQHLLSQRTLHLAVIEPSQSSPTPPPVAQPPSIVRPNVKSGVLSGWDDLEFDLLCAR